MYATPLGEAMQTRIKEYIENVARTKTAPVRICLLGYGTTNRAILDIIRSMDIKAKISVRQSGKVYDTPPADVEMICGKDALDVIDADIVFASPSVRRERLKLSAGTHLTSDTDIFFSERRKNLFLVSGSDGKSTVTTLASLFLSPSFPNLFTGGNLGTPTAYASLSSDAFLLELSSFNLRYCTPKSDRAVLTNVTPNHLDWHKDLVEYESTKALLIESTNQAVLPLSCSYNEHLASSVDAFALVSTVSTDEELRATYSTEHTVTLNDGKIFIDKDAILTVDEIARHEKHNVENLMSAIALTLGYATENHIKTVASSFNGLEHRCEHFHIGGIDYINSSIDTTPERTKATLMSLDRRVHLILGGRGKGLSPEPLRNALLKYAERIFVYGEIAEEIYEWIENDEDLAMIPHTLFSSLKEAIESADGNIERGQTLLLSPAATSYGEFKSFNERGRFFKEYIQEKRLKI